MVVIASMFRDSVSYLPRYFRQVNCLREHYPVQLVIAEGDSEDDTYKELGQYMTDDDRLLKVDHRGPKFGSVDHGWRWALLAMVGNTILESVPPEEFVIWVESDLMWSPETMLALLRRLDRVPAVAPLSMQQGLFYDVWGHRGLDGKKFERDYPYHPSIDGFTEIGSAGSCIAMRPDVAKVARFADEDCIVGLCRSIREHGHSLWLDPSLSVVHP